VRARALAAAAALLLALPVEAKKPALAAGEQVDLNTATVSDLMRLPGVGKKRAQAIVAHRQKQRFRRPEEVTRVKGVSEAWFARVKPHLIASGVSAPRAPTLTTQQPKR
jgi:competence protein ComEA